MLTWLIQVSPVSSPSTDNSIVNATWVIAGATIIYVIATIALWLTTRKNTALTRDIFEAAHRPYLAINLQKAVVKDIDTKEATDDIGIGAVITNHGSVPANEVRFKVELVVQGAPLDVRHPEKNILDIPPKGHAINITTLNTDETKQVVRANALTLRYFVLYKGIKQEYSYEMEAVYYVDREIFAPTRQGNNGAILLPRA